MQSISNSPEEWRPVPGWEGIYEVSNHGRVRSMARVVIGRDGREMRYRTTVLTPSLDPSGYPRINLYRNKTVRRYGVHRLVLAAFVGPCPDGMEVLHGDGNPGNSHLVNLSYGTSSENTLDTVAHGTHNNARKTECPQGHSLVVENLKPGTLKLGRRDCLACARTRSFLHRNPQRKFDFKEISDSYYLKIMSEN